MEETVQKLLQDVQNQVAELGKRKKEFEEQMKQQKGEFENWKKTETDKLQREAREVFQEKESNLNEREQKITAQEEFIRDQQLKNSKIIKLNVGGRQFTTTLTTLTSDKDSMLAAMFSGRYALEKDENGFYFVDRDGDLFSLVLHYLRDQQLPRNIEEDKLCELQREAQYYQLASLLGALNQPASSNGGLLNYGGLYACETKMITFIDSKFVSDFKGLTEYTVDPFNYILFPTNTGFIVDQYHISIDNMVLTYHAPEMPIYGAVYMDPIVGYEVIFKEESITIGSTEIQTETRLTKNGVPMIVLKSPSQGILSSVQAIYCFGTVCVARASVVTNPSSKAFTCRLFRIQK